jgi:uncharacterized protein (TIGR03067 family)
MKLLACAFLVGFLTFLADDAGQNKKDLDKMQGEWASVEMIRDGISLERDSAQAYFRTVEGEKYTISRYRKVAGTGIFKLNAAKSPREIDATPQVPGAKTLKGIYEWDGDKLKMIFGPPGGDRPADFKCPPGAQQSYTLWEREKK